MVRIIKAIAIAVKFALPWILRAFFFTLWLMAGSVARLRVGVPNAVRLIADEWLDKAVKAGYPTRYDKHLYYVLCTIAFLTMLAGWIIASYITVWFTGAIISAL